MPLPQNIRRNVNRQATNLLETGTRFKRFDQIRQRYFWSMARFTADANGYIPSGQTDVFTTPVGQAGQGFAIPLTMRETNWQGAARVPDNQNLEVVEIGVSCQRVNNGVFDGNSPYPSAMENELLRNLAVAITYLTNQVPLGMCTDFAQASGPTVGEYHPATPGGLTYDAGPPITVELGNNATPAENVIPVFDSFYTNGFPAPALRRKFKIPILLQHGETFKWSFLLESGRGPYVGTDLAFDVRLDMWATESFVEKS